ncbi:MAG: hypothetical protein M3292_04455 [Actinomycetota bacterium]|nr:hypothetical protein [Actinomycetota bacterium]
MWATLIALLRDGEVTFGVVSAPALGHRWWAARGEGAFRDGQSIRACPVARRFLAARTRRRGRGRCRDRRAAGDLGTRRWWHRQRRVRCAMRVQRAERWSLDPITEFEIGGAYTVSEHCRGQVRT